MAKINVFNRPMVFLLGSDEDTCLISISTPNHPYPNHPISEEGWRATLFLEFHDVDGDKDELSAFTVEQAKQILDFVEDYPDKDIIIHCDAGISRSVAVGSLLASVYDYQIKYNIPPYSDMLRNSYVYSILRREWYKRQAIYEENRN